MKLYNRHWPLLFYLYIYFLLSKQEGGRVYITYCTFFKSKKMCTCQEIIVAFTLVVGVPFFWKNDNNRETISLILHRNRINQVTKTKSPYKFTYLGFFSSLFPAFFNRCHTGTFFLSREKVSKHHNCLLRTAV